MGKDIVWIGMRYSGLFLASSQVHSVRFARSGKRGFELIQQQVPALVVIDAQSLQSNGERIIAQLLSKYPSIGILLLHEQALPNVAHLPPSADERQFLHVLEHLVGSDAGKQLRCGNWVLDERRRILSLGGRDVQLNPKQGALLSVFFRQPNETLARAHLMKAVWNTDYTGDTRTLDVHIRWLRTILEPDPQVPRHLLTVRGVGYRLAP